MGSGRKAVVGAFIVGGLLLFAIGLFLIGDRRRLFEQSFVVYAEFARLGGLQNGAAVRVAGLGAGEVQAILYPSSPRDPFRVQMRVVEDLHPLIRTDSVAYIRTEGLVGNQIVEIAQGTAEAPMVEDGGTIPGQEPLEIADIMQKAMEVADVLSNTVLQIEEELVPTIASLRRVSAHADVLLNEVSEDLTAITGASQAVAEDVQAIVADARAGRGTVGKLLYDDELHTRIHTITGELEVLAGDARVTMENVRDLTTEAKSAVEGFRSGATEPGMMTDLRRTLSSAREVASDLAENAESLKRNFLFRGLFLERGFFDLNAITPREYVAGALGDHHLSLRIWIGEDELLEVNEWGREVLSEQGKARIRSAMTEVLQFPPNSPMMVEGYAGEGSLDERFLKARRWSFLVREYVIDTFYRDPNYTGFIALESMTPEELAGRDDGELEASGVVIALYYDDDVARSPRPRVVR